MQVEKYITNYRPNLNLIVFYIHSIYNDLFFIVYKVNTHLHTSHESCDQQFYSINSLSYVH